MTLANRLRIARSQRGLSQRSLAQRLGVTGGAVAQWETGQNAPGLPRLRHIAETLGVTTDWLLDRAEAPPPLEPSDAALLQEARSLGLDLPALVKAAREQRWREANQGALSDANDFLARHGLWSDGKRLF